MLLTIVFLAGLWAGLQNTLAGGGSFVTLPALRVGQSLRVKLVSTSVERGFIDFVLA